MGGLLIGAFFVALLLVPLGLLFGVIARLVLFRRRSWARRNLRTNLDGRSLQASAAITGQQVVDRALSVVLLTTGAYLVALTSVSAALDANGFVGGNTTTLGEFMLAAGGVGALCVLIVLVAIPVSAVLIVRQIRDQDVLAGEAFALANRTGRHSRIRADRTLSWITFLLFGAAAVATSIAAAPAFVGFR